MVDQNALHFRDVRHLGNGPALGDVAVAFVFGKTLAEVGDFEMAFAELPNLSLGQHGRAAVFSQSHNKFGVRYFPA